MVADVGTIRDDGPMELILASTSPYRRELLARLGLPFLCVPPGVVESEFLDLAHDPAELVRTLASAKAAAVAAQHPGAVVIGSDQLVAFEGQVLGKPGSVERAVSQLLALAGREHQLLTAVAIADTDGVEIYLDVARLWVRPLTLQEARRYVDAEQPLDCAGSYKIEGLGITLFDRIESADQTAIIGLPLLAVCKLLRARGFVLP
jgi:septum formation protein